MALTQPVEDNRHDVVRSVRKGTWFSESKLAITIILRLTRYWFGKSMNAFVVNDLKLIRTGHKLVDDNFHEFLASIARVYPPTDHDEMQASISPTKLISFSTNEQKEISTVANHVRHEAYNYLKCRLSEELTGPLALWNLLDSC
ncbi:hypothetical protein TNCV_507291 [Trichonephila clavipes]|nr:hypothetical protein TNCV_507291 [Trichonephila clavipes]